MGLWCEPHRSTHDECVTLCDHSVRWSQVRWGEYVSTSAVSVANVWGTQNKKPLCVALDMKGNRASQRELWRCCCIVPLGTWACICAVYGRYNRYIVCVSVMWEVCMEAMMPLWTFVYWLVGTPIFGELVSGRGISLLLVCCHHRKGSLERIIDGVSCPMEWW